MYAPYRLAFVAIGVAAAAIPATAAIVHGVTLPFDHFRNNSDASGGVEREQVVLALGIRANRPPHTFPTLPLVPNPLFENYRATPGDVGTTFTATRATDPDFDAFVGYLVNGLNDEFIVALTVFLDNGPGLPGGPPDLQFNHIDSISLRLDAYTVADNVPLYPGSTTLGRRRSGEFTLTFEGTPVPEPATGALVGAAAAAGLVRRPRRPTRLATTEYE